LCFQVPKRGLHVTELKSLFGLKQKKKPGQNLGKPIQHCHKWVGEGGKGSTPKQKRARTKEESKKP